MDHARISEQMESAHRLALISSVLMITYSTVGVSISGVQALKEKLKSEICTLLEGVPERWGGKRNPFIVWLYSYTFHLLIDLLSN